VGYNAHTDLVADLIEDNIIDSTKSIRTALENAMSVAKLLLNTSVVITLNNK
jgi:chaperonin GroEL